MTKYTVVYFLSTIALFFPYFSVAQCVVKVFADPPVVACGGRVELSAFGSGDTAFVEDFNAGIAPAGWDFTQTLDFSNPCSPSGVDGTPHMWMGDAADNPRDMVTVGFDVALGGTICFDLMFATQGELTPCEGPDLPDEGVYIQYSIDNGTTWKTINYFDPNGGQDPQMTTWNNYCFNIPTDGQTADTKFRWHQDTVSANIYDHWGVDNIVITLNKPPGTSTIIFHDGTVLPHPGGINPNKAKITADQSFSVTMLDGNKTCMGTVDVKVVMPNLVVDVGNDTTLCEGECETLNSVVKVIIDSAKTIGYSNNETNDLVLKHDFFGPVSDSSSIFISGLNTTNLTPGSITKVCINEVTSKAFSNNHVNDADIKLKCPSGQTINLIPIGTTPSPSFTASSSIVQTCFSPSSSTNITTSTAPYSGTWSPIESFDNLVGCQSNGIWSLMISPPASNPNFSSTGTIGGWSIEFDDPETSYTPNITWSPTTDFQNPSVDVSAPQPTICSGAANDPPITYKITASDTANCVTLTDSLEVRVKVCCDLQIDDTTLVKPTCGNADGEIDIIVSGAAANLTFSINDGAGYQTPQPSSRFTNLPAGLYDIIVNDVVNCPDTIFNIALIPNNSPTITNIVASPDPSCGANDGGITITANGGTGALEYSIDDGTNYSNSSSFTMQAEGQYRIKVRDALGCEYPELFDLVATGGAQITNVAVVPPNCGGTDGSITVTASGGSGSYMYSLDMTAPVANNVFSNLSTGTYNIIVSDGTGCTADSTVVIGGAASPVINSIDTINPSCGIDNGTISITASGGTAPLTYRIDNTTAFGTNTNYTSLSIGNYLVEVQDGNGCIVDTLIRLENTSTLKITLNSINAGENCVNSENGSAVVLASGGVPGGYGYNWSGGIAGAADAQADNLGAGTYTVTVSDNSGCSRDTTFTIRQLFPFDLPIITTKPASCEENCDGEMTIIAHPGFTLSLDSGKTNLSSPIVTGLCDSIYSLQVTDTLGCDVFVRATIDVDVPPFANFTYTQDRNADPLTPVIIFTNQSQGTYFYNWDFGIVAPPSTAEDTSIAFPRNSDSTYTVCLTARDSSNCESILCQEVEIESVVTFFAPNTITADGDGLNDAFRPIGIGWDKLDYRLRIFSRWGDLIFETEEYTTGWNGKTKGSSKFVREGVYIWEVKLSGDNFITERYHGHVNVLIAQ